jgi:DNA-binding transcriptional LysR family regulator
MSRIDWGGQVGRRFRLRDLHVFFTVAQRGSMAKAAAELRVSQPAVSAVIADLEGLLGVKLFDRGSHGVEPTVFGRALLKRSVAAFDELRQSVTDIEFLGDAKVGQVRIGALEAFSGSILTPVIHLFSRKYPNVVLHVDHSDGYPTLEFPDLRNRRQDFILAPIVAPEKSSVDDLNLEILFDERIAIAVGPQNRLGRRRKLDPADLVDEPWTLTAPHSWMYSRLEEAFRARGLDTPKVTVVTFGVQLRASLVATGNFISVFPRSFLRMDPCLGSLKVLPIDLHDRPWPVAIVTLKNRALSPVAELLIEHLRTFVRSMRI